MAAVTTTISLIGGRASEVATQIASAANVSTVPVPEEHDDPLDRHGALLQMGREARRHPPVYTILPADPLGAVVEAWRDRLAGVDDRLEVLIGTTPADPLPHYYLVGVDLEEPAVHWYHGLVASASAVRIVPVRLAVGPVLVALRDLPRGSELPAMDVIARRARDFVPLPEFAAPSGPPA